jgi:hypothetical protein
VLFHTRPRVRNISYILFGQYSYTYNMSLVYPLPSQNQTADVGCLVRRAFNGTATGFAAGVFELGIGETIAITYDGALSTAV